MLPPPVIRALHTEMQIEIARGRKNRATTTCADTRYLEYAGDTRFSLPCTYEDNAPDHHCTCTPPLSECINPNEPTYPETNQTGTTSHLQQGTPELTEKQKHYRESDISQTTLTLCNLLKNTMHNLAQGNPRPFPKPGSENEEPGF